MARKKRLVIRRGTVVSEHELVTLQIAQIQESKGLFTRNVGENLQRDLGRLKRRGLITWHKKGKESHDKGLAQYAGLGLTQKGIGILGQARKTTGATIFPPRRRRK